MRQEQAPLLVAELLKAGVSKDEIAVACGLSWWTVFRWQRGERAPHPLHFARLERFHSERMAASS